MCTCPLDRLQTGFLALLARIELHAKVAFRDVLCHDKRADAIAETIALAWKWYIRLVRRGKDPARFPSALATFAARAVRSGRRLCGQEKAKDVLSPQAQLRHGFTVHPLPDVTNSHLDEALRDNTRTEVPEQAAFRVDFPAWRRTLAERDRRLVDDLMVGERTSAVARRFGVSPARVAQKRQEFHRDWQRFEGDTSHAVAGGSPAVR